MFTVANASLGLHRLAARSFWADEAATWLIANQHGEALLQAIAHQGGDTLLYYLSLHWLVVPVADTAFSLRLPSVLCGVATVPVVYGLGKAALGSRWSGVASSALMAVTAPLVFWQQNARAYSADALLAALTTLTFVLAVRTQRSRSLAAWAVVSVVAISTSLLSILVLLSQIGALGLFGLDRRTLTRWGKAVLGVGAGCVPVAVLAIHQGGSQIAWLRPPTWAGVKEVTAFLAGATSGQQQSVSTTGEVLAWTALLLWFGGLLAVAATFTTSSRARVDFGPAVVAAGVFVPFTAAIIVSFAIQPVFADRYLLMSVPAATVLLVYASERLRARPLIAVSITVLVLLRTISTIHSFGPSLEDNHGVAAYVFSHSKPNDCIALFPNGVQVAYDFYAAQQPAGRAPHQVLPAAPSRVPPSEIEGTYLLSQADFLRGLSPAALRAAARCPRLWFLTAHTGSAHGTVPQQDNFGELSHLENAFGKEWRASHSFRFRGVNLILFYGPRHRGRR